MAQTDQDKFSKQIVAQQLLSLEELSECIAIKEQCRYLLGMDLPLYHVILEKYHDKPDFLQQLLQVRLQALDEEPTTPVELLKPGTPPETEQMILDSIQERTNLTQEQLYECLDIQFELSKMGLAMAIPDILVGKGYVKREIVAELVGPNVALPMKTAMFAKQKPRLNIGKIARRTKDGRLLSVDLGELALHNKLITASQLEQCVALRAQCQERFNLDFPMGQILFEKFHLDRSLLRSLYVIYYEIRFRAQQEAEDRRRLVPQGQAQLLELLRNPKALAPAKLKQALMLQKKLKSWGLSKTIADILVLQKHLSDKSLAQLKLPVQKVDESLPDKKLMVRMDNGQMPKFGKLALDNQVITKAQLEEALQLQQRCRQLGLPFKIGEILVDKGYLLPALKRALLIGQAHLLAQQSLQFNIFKFSPRDHRILGRNLENVKTIPPEELQTCREIQELLHQHGISKSISELLVMRQVVSQEEIAPVLERHRPKPLSQRGPGTKGLRIPDEVISQGERELPFGRLAVYNEYLTQEELEECLEIQQRCQQEFDFELDLGLILLKKGYISQKNLRLLLEQSRKIQEYLDWSYHYSWLKFSAEEEQRILESVHRSNLVIPSIFKECQLAQQKVRALGLPLSLVEVMVYRKVLNEETIMNILGRRARTGPLSGALRKANEVYPERTGYLFMADFIQAKQGKGPQVRRAPVSAQPQVQQPPVIDSEVIPQEEIPSLECLDLDLPSFEFDHSVLQMPLLEKVLFGQIALQKEFISSTTLEHVLLLQDKLRQCNIIKKIGEILVDLKLLTLARVQEILEQQQKLVKRTAWPAVSDMASEDTLVKELILQNKLLSPGQLARCLYIQKTLKQVGYNKSLSNILYESGALNQGILGKLLLEHRLDAETSKRSKLQQSFREAQKAALRKQRSRRAKPR